MIKALKGSLEEIRHIINGLDEEEYSLALEVLSGSSVAAHVRHVIEFYQAILLHDTCNIVCYDERKRDARIETDRNFALTVINELQNALREIKEDRRILLKCNFKFEKENNVLLDSSLFRELAYAFEHGIHHQAIIKIGIRALGREEIINHNFGVAPSTVRFKKQMNSVLPR